MGTNVLIQVFRSDDYRLLPSKSLYHKAENEMKKYSIIYKADVLVTPTGIQLFVKNFS